MRLLERISPPVAGPSGVFTRWVLPHQASEVVQLPACPASPILRQHDYVLRAQEDTADSASVHEYQEGINPTDVLYRAVRNAGQARSSTLAPSIDIKRSLIPRKANNLLLTLRLSRLYDFLILSIIASFAAQLFGSSPCIITVLDFRSLPVTHPSLRHHSKPHN